MRKNLEYKPLFRTKDIDKLCNLIKWEWKLSTLDKFNAYENIQFSIYRITENILYSNFSQKYLDLDITLIYINKTIENDHMI